MKNKDKFSDWPIKKKLLFSHGSIVALACVIIVIILAGMMSMRSKLDGLYNGSVSNVDNIGNIRIGFTDIQRAINRILAEGEENATKNYPTLEKAVTEDLELINSSVASLKKTLISDANKESLKNIEAKLAEGAASRKEIMELLKVGEFEAAYDLTYGEYIPIINECRLIAAELETSIKEVAKNYYETANSSVIIMFIVGIVLMVLGTLVAFAIAAKITLGITGPIQQILEASTRMHEGDLSSAELLTFESEDEIGVLAASLRGTMNILSEYVDEISSTLKEMAKGDLTKDSNDMTDFRGDFSTIKESFVFIYKRFNSTLSEIQATSKQVDTSSDEIARASHLLSEGTTDEASAVEELTATVDTVADMANESAEKTEAAFEMIRKSTDKAEDEMKKMDELTEEMKRITEISKQIQNIITAIEDIASQTNLLSPNASIEAARAGDAGRGFAVVADQIGKLASDSAQSAVNTRELIEKTLEEIEKGNEITKSTSVAFEEVINDMREFAEVAKATTETAKNQAVALGQISEGIEEISAVIQNTAATSDESASISAELSRKAEELDELVGRFQLY